MIFSGKFDIGLRLSHEKKKKNLATHNDTNDLSEKLRVIPDLRYLTLPCIMQEYKEIIIDPPAQTGLRIPSGC